MSEKQDTPRTGQTEGPWAVHPFAAQVCPLDRMDQPICGMLWPTEDRTEEESFANARLIAAAPDLLRALEAAEEHDRACQTLGEFVKQGVATTAEWNAEYDRRLGPAKAAKAIADELRRAALAKAKGDTP